MSGVTHEIVSIQFGHYSNFVGTHWWNTQEASFVYDPKQAGGPKEINHDVMFREGQNLLGDVTYTPRLVLADLKGSLNTLRQEGRLYELPEDGDDVKWNSDVTMHKTSSLPKNEFLKDLEMEDLAMMGEKVPIPDDVPDTDMDQDVSEVGGQEAAVFGSKLYDLDSSVQVWSDYLSIHLHPKSVNILQQYQHESESEPFDLYVQGHSLYKDSRTREDIEDRIHFFVEECDHLQGVHIMTDIHNGFGGLSTAFLQDLEDELENKSLLLFGVSPPVYGKTTPTQDSYRLMSMALTIDKLANHSSAFVPLSLASSFGRKPGPSVVLPNLHYTPELAYHTGAILAAGLDTVTVPYRLDRPPSLLAHLTQALTSPARKILSLYSSLPFHMEHESTLADSLLRLGNTLPWQPLTPGCRSNVACAAQSLVVRGIPLQKLKGALDPQRSRVLDQCDTLQELMTIYLKEMCSCSLNAICGVQDTYKVTAPFPHIFSPNVSKQGYFSAGSRNSQTGVDEVPVMATLQSTSAVHQTLRDLLRDVKKIDLKRHHKILDDGLEEDDYRESLNSLNHLVDNYNEHGDDML